MTNLKAKTMCFIVILEQYTSNDISEDIFKYSN